MGVVSFRLQAKRKRPSEKLRFLMEELQKVAGQSNETADMRVSSSYKRGTVRMVLQDEKTGKTYCTIEEEKLPHESHRAKIFRSDVQPTISIIISNVLQNCKIRMM